VEVCENDNTNGYTPDVQCISHTMSTGESFTFSFVNRKTSPPPPTMEVKNVTSPEEVYSDGETYPNLYADAYTPNGHSITCVIGVVNPNDHSQSGYGSILAPRSYTFVSAGYNRVGPYTYKAPADTSAIGKYDQIEVTCHDNTNSAVANASAFSLPIPIRQPPVVCCVSKAISKQLEFLART
jgi:hypothetical protein